MSTLATLETVAEIADRKGLTLHDAIIAILAERLKLPKFSAAGVSAADRRRRELLTTAHDAIRTFEDVAD